MRAARIYRPAELIGGKINHLQVQACHGPAKGCLLGWGQRCHTRATQPRLGRACGRSDRGELRRSPRICPEQEGRYLGRRPAVKPLPCPSHRGCRTAWPDPRERRSSRLVATPSASGHCVKIPPKWTVEPPSYDSERPANWFSISGYADHSSKGDRPSAPTRRGKQPAETCHNADSPRTVAITILPTQGLAAGSVAADTQRDKGSPGHSGALRHQGRCLVLTRRSDVSPRHKSGKAQIA